MNTDLSSRESSGDYRKYKGDISVFLYVIFLSLLIMLVTFAFASAPLDIRLFFSYFIEPFLLFMNFIPIFLILSFFFLIFNRLWLSYFSTCFLIVTMSIINKFKLMYRDEPFAFVDLKLVRESLIMAREYDLSLSYKIIILIIFLLGIGVFIKFFLDCRIKEKKVRMMLLFLLFIMSFIIFKGFYFNPYIYEAVGNKNLINIWLKSDQFKSKGFIYPFIYSIKDAEEVKLAGYNEKKAIEDLHSYGYSHIPRDKKVNIISIMLEAYNDFSKFQSMDIKNHVYRNLHKIQDKSISGNLVTNIFAGGTIDTERAFLTGYFKHPKYFRKTNSFIWYLNSQGYKTEAMHPITGSFYNRRNINQHLGFKSFHHFDNKYKDIQEAPLEDMDFFDFIIKGYEASKAEAKPYFNFSVTYQNHGPYSTEDYGGEEYLSRKKHYKNNMYNIINNYLSGIAKTDKALKKIIDYFEKEEEPVVVVLFGDHNPWLGENHIVYDMLGINLDIATLDGFKNYYETPYIIWGNQGAKNMFNKDFIKKGNDISPHFLMAGLFQYIGWEGDEYMKYLSSLKEKMDVTHEMYFKEKGEYKKELSKEGKTVWKDFLNVQHYYSHNFSG